MILELIIYVVILGLIVVLVASGQRYFRNLTYVMHAKQDAKVVQDWAMGQYQYNGYFPNRQVTSTDVTLTKADGNTNDAEVKSDMMPNGDYCVHVTSNNILDPNKRNFWIDSDAPQTIVQSQSPVDLPCLPPIPYSNVDPNSKNYPLCHDGNKLNLPFQGIINGHDGHSDDIIPPIPVESYNGKNWNKQGAKTFDNNCIAGN